MMKFAFFMTLAAIALAAPDASPLEHGVCGGFAGDQCPPGYFCHYSGRPGSLGVCRRGAIPPTVSATEVRGCGAGGVRCPPGYFCEKSDKPGSLGVCRHGIIPPDAGSEASPEASSEELHSCGGFSKAGCPEGHYCRRGRGIGGVCYKASACGGIAALQCPEGFQCTSQASHPDASGYCFPA